LLAAIGEISRQFSVSMSEAGRIRGEPTFFLTESGHGSGFWLVPAAGNVFDGETVGATGRTGNSGVSIPRMTKAFQRSVGPARSSALAHGT
jgi:hypothetical protein